MVLIQAANSLLCPQALILWGGVCFQENVGADSMEPIPVAEGIRAIPVPALPPYNGFGSFEDSEQSCKNLVSTEFDSHSVVNSSRITVRQQSYNSHTTVVYSHTLVIQQSCNSHTTITQQSCSKC